MATIAVEQTAQGLQRYRIKEKIGSGGMATVFLAHDGLLGRDVALKMMHEHLMTSPETVRRFSDEARTVAMLAHENIVKVYDCGPGAPRPYLVMEYIEGVTLGALIARHGILPNLVAVEIARQIAFGLSYAHGQGVFHRDIKPDNIMVDCRGNVKIMDFGIAYLVNKESLTMTGSLIGSPQFISPEQAESRGALTGTTDIFSLGVILYHTLSGNLPFDAETPAGTIHSIIHHIPPSILKSNRRVLFWLSDLVDAFLTKDPVKRPDAQAALASLEKKCADDGLLVGKQRLVRFLEAPASYADQEYNELFQHYRARARQDALKKKTASALKKLEQAKAFGALAAEDEKIITNSFRCRYAARFCAAMVIAVCCAASFQFLHAKKTEGKKNVFIPLVSPMAAISPSDSFVKKSPPPVRSEPGYQKVSPAGIAGIPSPTGRGGRRTLPKAMVAGRQTGPSARSQGFLSIKTNPPWVKVFIDGIERGTTPAIGVFQVPLGPHALTLVKEGFAEYVKTLSIAANDTVRIKARLLLLAEK